MRTLYSKVDCVVLEVRTHRVVLFEKAVHLLHLLALQGLHDEEAVVRLVELGPTTPRGIHSNRLGLGQGILKSHSSSWS